MSIFDLSMFDMHPKADEKYVVKGEKYRITVLTEQMLRLEYSDDGEFEDRATRLAFNRAFDTPEFESYYEDGLLHIVTKHLHLRYDEKEFSDVGMQIFVDGNRDWRYGAKPITLGGTLRTLDGVDGAKPLPDGLLSNRHRFATLDDSSTIAIDEDGWPVPVTKKRIDLYFFGYNLNFEKCIKDFYKLSCPTPLLPRYALGNWWSRYYKYTDKSYLALMDKFKGKQIPLSVGVVDMDWHITETPDPVKYGTGWTGYTWNKEYFPDHVDFLKKMHDRKLRVTLNLHPRDGVRAFEEVYPKLCERLSKDAATGRQIEFDASSKEFMTAYFDTVMNSLEDEGIDFWWIDWQQRGGMRIEGYDVLWMLNHCHYTDNARRGERPLTLSRYAGVGSHRYPLGFSGDTTVSWASLDFQPYFTSTAANVGFSWWSHDIGGHRVGVHNNELATRWVQYGVFSPIMRLHSSPSDFTSKEPWNYDECEGIQADFMRLRHKLIPYIYTMMHRNFSEGIPMVRPIYHKYPEIQNAYGYKNEYFFGDMIAAPITSPVDADSRLASVKVWLPSGTYVDFFSGRIYAGDRNITCYRHLDTFPLFVKAGSIIPLNFDAVTNDVSAPEHLELYVVGGDSGSFTMLEDNDKVGENNVLVNTEYSFTYGEKSVFTISAPVSGGIVPESRTYTLRFAAFTKPVSISKNEKTLGFTYDEFKNEIICDDFTVNEGESVTVEIIGDGFSPENEIENATFHILKRAQTGTASSDMLKKLMSKNYNSAEPIVDLLQHVHFDQNNSPFKCQKSNAAILISDILTHDIHADLKGALIELLAAK